MAPRPSPAGLAAAADLHARGVTEQNLGHLVRALRLLNGARAALDAEPALAASPAGEGLAAAIWISIALNHAEVRGADRGAAALREARARAARTGDPALLVRVHSQSALIALRIGEYGEALEQFAAAETMLEHADDNDTFAILLNAGTLRLFRGDLAGARSSLTRAVDFARGVGMRVGEFKALHNLGYLEFLAGDLPRALHGMNETLKLGADLPRGIPLLDRARVLAEAGLTREADVALAEAGEIFRRDSLAQDLAEVELERARCALVAGDVPAARRFAAQARNRFRRRGNHRWRRSAETVLLQGDLAAGRPASRLIGPAVRLKAELDAEGLPLNARIAGLIAAEAYLAAQRPDEAAAVIRSVRPPSPSDPITGRMHYSYVSARLRVARGEAAAASRIVRGGLRTLDAYQASFGSIDLQTAAAVHGRRLGDLGIAIALSERRAAAVFLSLIHI